MSRPPSKDSAVKRALVTFLSLLLISVASFASPSNVRSTSPPRVESPGLPATTAPQTAPVTTEPPQPPTTEAPAPPEPTQRPVEAVQTGCCQHSDAWWHGVAICEQGGRNDPYFGYFSFMDGSAGGKSWDEQVAMGNALLARVGHEIGPWAESCVRAGYNASPSG